MKPAGAIDEVAFRHILNRALLAPLVLVLLLAAILLVGVFYLLSLQQRVQRSNRIIEHAYLVERLLVDLETGVRGYVISNDPAFLEPYERAAARISLTIDELEQLLADSPAQRKHVADLRARQAEWQQVADQMLAHVRDANPAAAATIVRSGAGKRLMDGLRAILDQIVRDRQAQRAGDVSRSTLAARVAISTTIGLSIAIALVLALITRRGLMRVRQAHAYTLAKVEQANRALRASEERYRRLVEFSPDGIFVQAGGRIVYANGAMAAIAGASDAAALVGREVFELVHPDYHEIVRERIRTLREQRQDVPPLQERIRRLDGSGETWVEISATPIDFDEMPAAHVIVRDISQRTADQHALERSQASLARAQAIASLGNWEWDLVSNDIYWSDEMYRIFGMDRAAGPLTLEAFARLLHADDRARVTEAIEAVVHQGGRFDLDYRITALDGAQRYMNAQGEAALDGRDKPARLFGTVQDITARKRIEEALRLLNETLEMRVSERTAELRDANDDLRAFAYSITHDLRAPLRSMQGFAQALMEDHADQLDDTARDYIRRIVAASARMDRLTVELLEYNQLLRREIVPQRISLVLVLHDVVGQVQRDPELPEGDVHIHEPMPWVLAHRATLATVLFNLISNALKFVASGVRPDVHVRAETASPGVTRVWIADNGIGIAPEHAERIFDVFERLHGREEFAGGTAGSGLGLAVVRRGVERMGGRVGVETTVGNGSHFWIELPKDPESPS